MDESFLKEHAARCRSLADKADEFTKRRLLDLAVARRKRVGVSLRHHVHTDHKAAAMITPRVPIRMSQLSQMSQTD
jgi:hypothetical protein